MFMGNGPIYMYHGHLIGTLTQDRTYLFIIDSNRNGRIYISCSHLLDLKLLLHTDDNIALVPIINSNS